MSGRTSKLMRRAMGMGRNDQGRSPSDLHPSQRLFLRSLKREYAPLSRPKKRDARAWMRRQAHA